MFDERFAVGIRDAHNAVSCDFKSLVVRAVFFSGLGHETNIRHGAHGLGIEGAVFAAERDHGFIHGGVATVGNDGEGVLRFALGVPHFAALADHGWHGGVDDDIARHMQVSNALLRVHHGQCRTRGEGGFEVRFDRRFFIGGELLNLGCEVAEAVVEINTQLGQHGGVFFQEIAEENLHHMTEENRV